MISGAVSKYHLIKQRWQEAHQILIKGLEEGHAALEEFLQVRPAVRYFSHFPSFLT
jgi:hypothetical protein